MHENDMRIFPSDSIFAKHIAAYSDTEKERRGVLE